MSTIFKWHPKHPDSSDFGVMSPPDVVSAAGRSARKRRVGPVYEDGSYGVNVGGKKNVFDPDTGRVRPKR